MRPYLVTNGDPLRESDALCDAVTHVYTRIIVGLYDYQNRADLDAAKRYWWRRLGGARLRFSIIRRDSARSEVTQVIPKALVPPDSRVTLPNLVFCNGPCHRPAVRMIVQYDGTMLNCCEDLTGAFALGNVYEKSLKDLWFSPGHSDLCRSLIAGERARYALCAACPLPPTSKLPGGRPLDFAPRRSPAQDVALTSGPAVRG